MLKYKCKTHMQICALLSQVHKHKEAVVHAREGIKIAHFLIKDQTYMTQFYNNELLQRRPLEEISIINNTKFSLLEKTSVKLLPILQSLLKRMAFESEPNETSREVRSLEKLFNGEELQVGGGSSLTDDADADMKNLLGYLN